MRKPDISHRDPRTLTLKFNREALSFGASISMRSALLVKDRFECFWIVGKQTKDVESIFPGSTMESFSVAPEEINNGGPVRFPWRRFSSSHQDQPLHPQKEEKSNKAPKASPEGRRIDHRRHLLPVARGL